MFVRNPKLTAPTQRDLNKLVLGPMNDPSIRYAQIFNILFVCFVFSTGLPLMIPVAAASFLLFYWVDKATFMWYFRKPPAYTIRLQRTMSGLMPLALLLHLAVGIWMLSESNLFTSFDLGGLSKYSDPIAAQAASLARSAVVTQGVKRITEDGVMPIFIFFLFILLWVVLQALWLVASRSCTAALHLVTCGQCLKGGGKGLRGGGEPGIDWDFSSPTYPQSMDNAAASRSRGRGGRRSVVLSGLQQKLQGRESYNMLLDPEIMYAFGIDIEWAKKHKGACRGC